MLKDSKIMITGAAGFIGSTLTDSLLSNNNYIIGYDNFNDYYSGKEKNIEKIIEHKNFSIVKGDILDYKKLNTTMNGVDYVFHLAAQPGVRYSRENPLITNRINIEGTINVLEAVRNNKVSKLINASSSSVYGNAKFFPVDENHNLQPISIYGVSKMAAERYCTLYSSLYGIPTVSLRYHTVYGPRGRPDMAIYKWINSIYNDEEIILYGDGTQTRDMTYVDDIVAGTISAAEKDTNSGDIFNLASGRKVSMNYIIQTLSDILKIKTKIIYEKYRMDDAKETHANIDKAISVLNYKPKTSIEEGLKMTVSWYETITN